MSYLEKICRAGVIAIALAAAAPAVAQEVELRLASYLPPEHFGTRLIIEPLIERIGEYTGGSVAVQNFPGGQLATAPGTLDAVTSGIANMGLIGVGYVGDAMPMSTIVELPGAFGDLASGHAAYWQLIQDRLLEEEFLANDVRPIMLALLPQNQIVMMGNPEIGSLADMAGLKIRVPHATAGEAIAAMGMVPVEMPISDLYLAMERGTVDGAVVLTASVSSYNLQEIAGSITTNLALGSIAFVVTVAERDWQALTPDQQEQVMRAGMVIGSGTVDTFISVNGRAEAALADTGMALVTLDDATLAQIDEALASIEAGWVEAVSARNPAAAEIAAAYSGLLATQ